MCTLSRSYLAAFASEIAIPDSTAASSAEVSAKPSPGGVVGDVVGRRAAEPLFEIPKPQRRAAKGFRCACVQSTQRRDGLRSSCCARAGETGIGAAQAQFVDQARIRSSVPPARARLRQPPLRRSAPQARLRRDRSPPSSDRGRRGRKGRTAHAARLSAARASSRETLFGRAAPLTATMRMSAFASTCR